MTQDTSRFKSEPNKGRSFSKSHPDINLKSFHFDIGIKAQSLQCHPREFLQEEQEDQEMEEAHKRVIKKCIICWNYLYLSQKLEDMKDRAGQEAFLDVVAHGSMVAWRHFNLLGEYDFSEEKLRDSIGIWLPKLVQ